MAEAVIAVVGLGYVGLPLAREASKAGLRVIGLDASATVVAELTAGKSRVDDISNRDIREMLDAGFSATTDPDALADARVYVICVPTPLSEDGGPDLAAVMGAGRSVARTLAVGDLVVLESTTYPGTTEEVLGPLLERESGLTAGKDFSLAFSPERIDPGNPKFGLRNTPKVVGGMDATSTERAVDFYGQVVDDVVIAGGTREAELAKLLENTYRHVNIALVNEMAQFSDAMGIDLWDSIRCAATKPFGFHAFYPGPGVGGHCIPIDPNYLSHHVRQKLGRAFRFVELAQEINSGMPSYVVSCAQAMLNDRCLAVKNARILLLGVTYKANISDERESPSKPIGEILVGLSANLAYWDPFVAEWNVAGQTISRATDADVVSQPWDLIILLQPHEQLDMEALASSASPVLDTRGTGLPGAVTI